MVIGGRHIGIPVSNLRQVRPFYEALGFRAVVDHYEEGPFLEKILGIAGVKIHVVKMALENHWTVELLEYHVPKSSEEPARARKINQIGSAHVAVTVDDIDKEYHRLVREGVSFISAPQNSPDGYARVAFCQDPEGNYLELVQIKNGA